MVREGKRIAILNFGALLSTALPAAEALDATVADMRFVKPLDTDLIETLVEQHDLIVTLEENAIAGGAGSAVSEFLNAEGIAASLLQIGLPDRFVDHGKHAELLAECGLDTAGIQATIETRLAQISDLQALRAVK